jgi:hypothetical protein
MSECTARCTGLYILISAGTGGDAGSGARTVGSGSAGGADARVELHRERQAPQMGRTGAAHPSAPREPSAAHSILRN